MTNNAHTFQVGEQNIYAEQSPIPMKPPHSEVDDAFSDDNEDDELEDLFPSAAGRTGGSLNDPFTSDDDSTPSHSLPIPPERLNPNMFEEVLSRLSCTGDYSLEDTDYAAMFTKFKIKVYNNLFSSSAIYLEPHFTRLLAVEHTLFLKPGSYTEEMTSVFSTPNPHKVSSYIQLANFLISNAQTINQAADE
ncbi:hypothetical protein V8B55DRAFT_1104879 [Mucor lusitanicus]|uniref:Uncharacterized protein n=1 Tax=Mucor lusitanicus CBS 277.49 TaxID=747725 RepID=A0A168GN79_MUCCL|nr:hypothetical protein MUCCIDRAFT_168020 [Mucor lusitanicus CBS 277.49]